MGHDLVTFLHDNVEDLFLFGGSAALSVGVGLQWGIAAAFMVAGILALCYGVWITIGVRR